MALFGYRLCVTARGAEVAFREDTRGDNALRDDGSLRGAAYRSEGLPDPGLRRLPLRVPRAVSAALLAACVGCFAGCSPAEPRSAVDESVDQAASTTTQRPGNAEAQAPDYLQSTAVVEAFETDEVTGLLKAPGWELVRAHCGSCHSYKLVTSQRGDAAFWAKTIDWMQRTQNLWPIEATQRSQIETYLGAHYNETDWGRRPMLSPALMPAG